MPVYEYKCDECGRVEEEASVKFQPKDILKSCLCGGGDLRFKLSLPARGNCGFKPFWTEHITGFPLEIKSRKYEEVLLRKHGLAAAG